MEQHFQNPDLLDQFVAPAFTVRNEVVTQVNYAAQQRLILPGTPVEQIIGDSIRTYREFRSGCLYLPVTPNGKTLAYCISRVKDEDLFVADLENAPELRVLALSSRELRAPLTGISAMSERIMALLAESGKQNEAAQFSRNLHQLYRLICNMSDAATDPLTELGPQAMVDMNAVFAEVFEKIGVLTEKSGITLHYKGLDRGVHSLAHVQMLHRAVYNLLSNSMKFMPKGGSIHAELSRHGSRLHLAFWDSGQGIDPRLLTTVFSRYRRESCIEDGRYGIGLGMILIRQTALAHGGAVMMEPIPGGGTRTTLTFAVRKASVGRLGSPLLHVDYAGGRDQALQELSDVLATECFE